MKRLTLKEGLARGFHPTYDVLAQGEWKWVGDGWVLKHEWDYKRLTLKEGLARGFHPTYDVLAQGKWKWVGDGWVLKHEWDNYRYVCKNCGLTAHECFGLDILSCDNRNEEMKGLWGALKHHGY